MFSDIYKVCNQNKYFTLKRADKNNDDTKQLNNKSIELNQIRGFIPCIESKSKQIYQIHVQSLLRYSEKIEAKVWLLLQLLVHRKVHRYFCKNTEILYLPPYTK